MEQSLNRELDQRNITAIKYVAAIFTSHLEQTPDGAPELGPTKHIEKTMEKHKTQNCTERANI